MHQGDVTCLIFFFFSLSAVPPWSLNREFFCLWMFSLLFLQTRKVHSFPVTFFFFLKQFWQQGHVQGGEECLGVKASGKEAGL